MRIPTTSLLLALAPVPIAAQDLPTVLYHVQDNGFGCANPMVTRSLTDPKETRRKNAAWLRETMIQGHCVSVTPQSPWKLVSLEGDVALMSYAGSVGPPGAYYLSTAELIDSAGRHPGESPVASAPAAALTAQPQSDGRATALAPNPEGDAAAPLPAPRRAGVLWVAIIAGLAVLAVATVFALQIKNPRGGVKP